MKKFRLLMLATLLVPFMASCSSDDDPVVEEEEVIETPIPADAEPGKVYAIKHDKKHDTCTFQFYYGKTRLEELGDAYMGASGHVVAYDSKGNIVFQYNYLQAPDTPERWYFKYEMGDTFTIPCFLCEKIRSFETRMYDGEDAFNDPVEHTYSWRSPHLYY